MAIQTVSPAIRMLANRESEVWDNSTRTTFTSYPSRRYEAAILWDQDNVQQMYWDHEADNPRFVDVTGREVPLEKRGQPLRYFVNEFDANYVDCVLTEIWSIGDLANRRRYAIVFDKTNHVILGVQDSIPMMRDRHIYLIKWATGVTVAASLEIDLQQTAEGVWVPNKARLDNGTRDVLPDIAWALSLPQVIEGHRKTLQEWWPRDDDVRHLVRCALCNGQYILRREFLRSRDTGGVLGDSLDVDINGYGTTDEVVTALSKVGYHLEYLSEVDSEIDVHNEVRAGTMVLTNDKQMRVIPLPATYPISIIGLTDAGDLAHQLTSASPEGSYGYQSMSPEAQVELGAIKMDTGFVSDEGLDGVSWRRGFDGPPELHPVRGIPGGRLTAVLVIFERARH